jgi:hypothetical protein
MLRLVTWLVLCASALGRPPSVDADGVAALDALEAAYTLHFLNLIRWDRPAPLLSFCVLGDSNAGDRMRRTLSDKTVHGQRIDARRVGEADLSHVSCDAIYIPASYADSAPTLLKLYEHTATVTISDIPGFAHDGGVIGFVVLDDRLRFDINESIASRKGLKISAKLLELARRIVR